MVYGFQFRVLGLGLMVQGSGLKVLDGEIVV
jgi:hypothetical protein